MKFCETTIIIIQIQLEWDIEETWNIAGSVRNTKFRLLRPLKYTNANPDDDNHYHCFAKISLVQMLAFQKLLIQLIKESTIFFIGRRDGEQPEDRFQGARGRVHLDGQGDSSK